MDLEEAYTRPGMERFKQGLVVRLLPDPQASAAGRGGEYPACRPATNFKASTFADAAHNMLLRGAGSRHRRGDDGWPGRAGETKSVRFDVCPTR